MHQYFLGPNTTLQILPDQLPLQWFGFLLVSFSTRERIKVLSWLKSPVKGSKTYDPSATLSVVSLSNWYNASQRFLWTVCKVLWISNKFEKWFKAKNIIDVEAKVQMHFREKTSTANGSSQERYNLCCGRNKSRDHELQASIKGNQSKTLDTSAWGSGSPGVSCKDRLPTETSSQKTNPFPPQTWVACTS